MATLARSVGSELSRRSTSGHASQRTLLAVSALLFVASAVVTVAWCRSMSKMGGMDMPGGWTMSMVWMRMPGQSWPGVAASFVGMWSVMMVAMMLPSLVPVLLRYRQAVAWAGDARAGRLTATVGVAYFLAWTVLGAALFPLGVAVAAIAMRQEVARLVPVAAGVVVVLAGVLQLTAWKERRLACCREEHWRGRVLPGAMGDAWRRGVRLAIHCGGCGASLTAILLVMGVMNLRAMVVVAVASIAERLAPDGGRVARGIGAVAVGAGLLLIVRALIRT